MTGPPPGPHGGDGHAVAAALGVDPSSVLDLSVSLNPFAPDVRALALGHLDTLTRYPDSERATHALAAAIGVDASRVVLTNGGSEAIALVAAELGSGWVDEPDFSLYRRHLPAALLPELLDRADLPTWSRGIADLRAQLVDVLHAHGLQPRPSDAPFVLVDRAAGLRGRLAPLGIVVRDCVSFGLPDCARIAVPDPDGLERLNRALEAVAAEEVPA